MSGLAGLLDLLWNRTCWWKISDRESDERRLILLVLLIQKLDEIVAEVLLSFNQLMTSTEL